MRLHIPEISWHGKEPVFSVDFSKIGPTWRLASAGADNDIKLWSVNCETEGKPSIEFRASLNRHTKAVNVVRFSPNEDILASGSDDNFVIIWKPSVVQDEIGGNMLKDASEVENKENWTAAKMLRGHIEDVYDLAWSPDGTQLISGSVDNSAIIWDVVKGQKLAIFKDHKHYVQGVTWDPLGQYLATLSTDRSCRLYSCGSHRCCYNINKLSHPGSKTGDSGETHVRSSRMFHDETLTTFFRRLSYTPDGSLLIVPAGQMDINDQNVNTSYIFTRSCPNKPAVCLPSPQKATVAIRCCPLLFQLQSDTDLDKENVDLEKSLFKLPYRMVFAVATLDSVLIYDTQQKTPFGYLGNIHYAALTDISWSSNGRSLIISSSDGYCSLVHFAEGELGKLYHLSIKEVLEKPSSFAVKNVSHTPQSTTDLGAKNSKRTSPVESEKHGTPGAKKKDPKRIDLYTVPIATANTPTSKGGQPTPRRVQLTSLTPLGEGTVTSDQSYNTPATPPSTISAPSRRIQLTTLVSDVGKRMLSPHQSSQTHAAAAEQNSKSNKTATPFPPIEQKPIKPRRVQLTSVPCEPVRQTTAGACEEHSLSATAPHRNSQRCPASQTGKSSTALVKSSTLAPKPRRVSNTLVLDSFHEENKTAKSNSGADSSSKTSDKINAVSKAPRRVQLTTVVETDPISQENLPKPECKAGESFEKGTSQSKNKDNSSADNSAPSLHSANNYVPNGKEQLHRPETLAFSTPQLSLERTELIRMCRTALDAISNAGEGADIHEIPAVQNMDNVERELLMKGRSEHTQLAAQQLAHGTARHTQAAHQVIQGLVQQPQAAQQLAHGITQQPQAAQQLAHRTAQQPQAAHQMVQGTAQHPQAALKLAQETAQQPQAVHQLAQEGAQQPQDVQHRTRETAQQPQAAQQQAEREFQQQAGRQRPPFEERKMSKGTPSERELESEQKLNQSGRSVPDNPTSSNATTNNQAKSRELPSNAVVYRDNNESTPIPRSGFKRPYPLEPDIIIINDAD